MNILLATDGSEYAERAARFLTSLNLSFEDEITIFHALYWIPFLYDRESYYDTLKEIKKEIAPRIIDSALKILKPLKTKICTAIIEGPPETCILDAAVESGADMVVMGARGIKGIKSLFIGSVTRSVAIQSSKPVLVTKLPVSEERGKIRILFATDGSDQSIATGQFLAKIPFHDDTEIAVLNIMPSEVLDIPETFIPEMNKKMIEIGERIRSVRLTESKRVVDQAREYLSKRFRKIHVLSEVGDPPAEILKTAETLKTDLIAVGSRGLRGIRGVMGSVSRNIITHSRVSVLIGKTHEE